MNLRLIIWLLKPEAKIQKIGNTFMKRCVKHATTSFLLNLKAKQEGFCRINTGLILTGGIYILKKSCLKSLYLNQR